MSVSCSGLLSGMLQKSCMMGVTASRNRACVGQGQGSGFSPIFRTLGEARLAYI